MKVEMVRCPNCGEFVESTATTCVFCKDNIGAITTKRVRVEYDKVPPRGLRRYQVSLDKVCDPIRTILIPKVKRIEILNPEKVLRFTFFDDSQIKTICAKEDKFDSELACYIAYAKMLNKRCYRNAYNAEGIVNMAMQLRYEKCYEKLVTKALKMYYKLITESISKTNSTIPETIIDKLIGAINKSGV